MTTNRDPEPSPPVLTMSEYRENALAKNINLREEIVEHFYGWHLKRIRIKIQRIHVHGTRQIRMRKGRRANRR